MNRHREPLHRDLRTAIQIIALLIIATIAAAACAGALWLLWGAINLWR